VVKLIRSGILNNTGKVKVFRSNIQKEIILLVGAKGLRCNGFPLSLYSSPFPVKGLKGKQYKGCLCPSHKYLINQEALIPSLFRPFVAFTERKGLFDSPLYTRRHLFQVIPQVDSFQLKTNPNFNYSLFPGWFHKAFSSLLIDVCRI
jgi:hypothetical protein